LLDAILPDVQSPADQALAVGHDPMRMRLELEKLKASAGHDTFRAAPARNLHRSATFIKSGSANRTKLSIGSGSLH